MVCDGLVLVIVCLGYGYAQQIAPKDTAMIIVCSCFVADNLLFALGAARATYLSKITDSAQDITSTLSMGVSINHIASMFLPALAGMIWITFGFEMVFLAGAILALTIAGLSLLVPRKGVLAGRGGIGR